MDRKTATLFGAAAVLAAGPPLVGPAAAEGRAVPVASSFAELLQPIPNAVERLKIADAERAAPARLIEAQYEPYAQPHHHHHHHHHSRSWYLHNGYYWYGGAWVLRPRPHHHHHHHHHHNHY
ncbi:MAG TPA: hypothetical protein VHY34_05150 [Caulobacteraceae bacterium]|nr:hypothetical protein [Caulobacteraceae bacterium]